jgi:hypothetical protein
MKFTVQRAIEGEKAQTPSFRTSPDPRDEISHFLMAHSGFESSRHE